MKITFMGAGSSVFAKNVLGDSMCSEALRESEIALYDIDGERLEDSFIMVNALNNNINQNRAKVSKYLGIPNRKDALRGADFVVNAIQVGRYDPCTIIDFEVPKKYGLRQTIGDSYGIGGIFRALRTIPVLADFARDMEDVCPNAWFLNYTNPMAMLSGFMQRYTGIQTVGLCHSVQGTAMMLARWIGAPYEEITYTCAGINHQAWYVEYKWNGEDAYPLIRKAVEKPEIYDEEQVRNEMFRHLGYYVTESSGHNSEYNWWFRKRPDLIEKYCTHGTGWNPGEYAYIVKSYTARAGNWREQIQAWLDDPKPLDLARGHEYAAYIANAYLGGEPFKFNGNVPNKGLIDNLPRDACVEVPVYADRSGLNSVHVGALPPQCAALNNVSVACEEMAVEACLTGDPTMVFHSIAYDPLTASVLSLAEIRQMVNEMLAKNRDYLTTFKHFEA